MKQLDGVTSSFSYHTDPDQKVFVPDESQQTFHLNMWAFNPTPPPTPTSVIVTNFQYEA